MVPEDAVLASHREALVGGSKPETVKRKRICEALDALERQVKALRAEVDGDS